MAKRLEEEKKERQKKKNEKPKDILLGHFLVQKLLKILISTHAQAVKCNASGKKGMLLCCKYLVKQIGANSAHIHPEKLQNV